MAERTALGTINYLREGLPDALQNEKRALLALIAEKGAEGAAEYQRQQEAAAAARNASLEQAAARGAAVQAPEALQAELTMDYDKLLGAVRNSGSKAAMQHGREMDRIQSASAAYYDAMQSQLPLLQAELDSQVAAAKAAADARGRSSGGGGGGGGGGGSDGFGGLLADMPETEKVDPNALANELAEYALRVPQSGAATRAQARQEALGMLDEALARGVITDVDYASIRRRLNQSFAAVDSGRAVTSSAQLSVASGASRRPPTLAERIQTDPRYAQAQREANMLSVVEPKVRAIANAILAGRRYSGTPAQIATGKRLAARIQADRARG